MKASNQRRSKSNINETLKMFVEEGNVAECEHLLKAKANPDLNHHLISLCFEDEETENRNELIRVFLKYKANVFLEDKGGRLAMFGCLLNSNMEGVKLLMEHNCSINIQNKNKQSFLHYALDKSCDELIKDGLNVREMMELGYDVNLQDSKGFTVLHRLMEKIGFEDGENSFLRLFFEEVEEEEEEVEKKLLEMLNAFLQHKEIKLDVKNKKGETPLHLAKQEDAVIKLLEAKADLNIRDKKRNTAFKAVMNNRRGKYVQVMKIFLESKCAVINLKNKNNSLFHLYLDVQNKEDPISVECIKLMIEHKLDLNQSLGQTTVHDEIYKTYCEGFGGCEVITSFVEYLEYSKSMGINISSSSNEGILNLLESAIRGNNSKSVDLLLGYINNKQDLSFLLLKLAYLNEENNRDVYSNDHCRYSKEQFPSIKVMVKRGVTCSHIDQILLHYILRHYKKYRDDVLVRSLVDAKADPNYNIHIFDEDLLDSSEESINPDAFGQKSYLEFAYIYNHISLVYTLLACGAEIPSQLSNVINQSSERESDVLIQNALRGGKIWSIKTHHLFCEKYVSSIRTFLLCLRAVGVSRRILPLPLVCRILESAVVYRTFPKMERRSSFDNIFDGDDYRRQENEYNQRKRKRLNNYYFF